MRGNKRWMAVLACAGAVCTGHAEPLYVIEQLVVSVTSEPGGAGDKVGSIKSGEGVELLEKLNGEAHVRLGNGKEGWVKSSYLSAEEPLHKQLSDRTAEVEKLKQDVSRLEGELAASRNAASAAPSPRPAPAPAANAAPVANPPPASPAPAIPDPAYFMAEPEQPARPVWHWVVGSSLLTLGVGFALGWWILDRRIRRKYGGLRIY